jgi:hypothetical protein
MKLGPIEFFIMNQNVPGGGFWYPEIANAPFAWA